MHQHIGIYDRMRGELRRAEPSDLSAGRLRLAGEPSAAVGAAVADADAIGASDTSPRCGAGLLEKAWPPLGGVVGYS